MGNFISVSCEDIVNATQGSHTHILLRGGHDRPAARNCSRECFANLEINL